ncbi:esterase/lipase family protein [Nocardia transvalensis]|uniref:esterase/lipase family protein n=1 Tax=Nocardia transvalensis TaxID=37333 RepID=UPI001895CF3B|nr:alpha/beta fold hydrolase [Nocardia transvalensis]MBF6327834.1 alpha/beta fold hydrolase [Nocardia transvalensis]
MRRRTRRTPLGAAVVAGVALLTVSFAGIGANAEPDSASSRQQQERELADYIAQGLKNKAARPIVDSGSAGTGSACTSGSGAGSGNGSGDCYGGSGSSSGSAGGTSSDTVGHGPAQSAWLAAFGYGLLNPDVAPPGTNDWNCKPTAEHPEPVVLVHGTWENAYDNFAFISRPIHDAGYCVFTFNYGRANLLQGGGLGSILPGRHGTGYIQESSKQLAAFVDRVLAATGAEKVNIVGHSQGGTMSRWYLKFDGGAEKVHHEITFGATNHGTTLLGIGALGRAINNFGIDVLGLVEIFVGHSGIQQTVGSDFINQLNAGGDTVPGVDYTVVGTRYDQVTTPYDLTFLRPGPGATVRNITLQDGCEQDVSDHLTIMYSPRALSIILNTLDPAQTPALECTFNPWLLGGGGKL